MDHFHIALSDDQLRAVSSIGLAHVGDAVYELLVRTWLCAHGKATGKDLHRAAIVLVCAPEQARRAQRILPLLTAEEETVFKRGRNASKASVAKHASPEEYRASTGFECLLGWLYLNGQLSRVHELFETLWQQFDPNVK